MLRSTDLKNRYVTLTQYDIKWYKSAANVRTGKFDGCIKFSFIFEMKKVFVLNGMPSFTLGVSLYETLQTQEAGKRRITFTCQTAQIRDKWFASIDYLRCKAVYDTYTKSNSLVNFMGLANHEERKKVEEKEEMDLSDLLYDFGDNLKSQTFSQHRLSIMPGASQNKSLT